MKFVLKKDAVKSSNNPNVNNGCNFSWYNVGDEEWKIINMAASVLSDRAYHELCHQLNGKKSEFDGVDDGEVHKYNLTTMQEKKAYTIRAALYRGIFGSTLAALRKKDEEKMAALLGLDN